jgi:hypothetical protein
MSKKINQLDALTSAEAKNDSWLVAQAEPITGVAKKMTVAQAKEVYATKKLKYTATGSEGTSLVIGTIAGYDILLIMRESGPLYQALSSPDPSEFTWDDTTIVLGVATNPGERFLILYRTY